jgi:hypothetical protein
MLTTDGSRVVVPAPQTPRTSRKRKRELSGDDVPSEARQVRRSERLAKKGKNVNNYHKRPKLGLHSYVPVWNLPNTLSDYEDISRLEAGAGFLDQRAGLFNGNTKGFMLAKDHTHFTLESQIFSRMTL